MKSARPLTAQQALTKLQDLCARAEHCEGEARERLRRWGVPSGQWDAIIAALVEERYIDDARFARAFVRDKVRFGRWGFRKIAVALAQKRVDRQIAAEAIAEQDKDEYYQALLDLIRSKTRAHPALLNDFDGRQRLYRFALSRGFESSLVSAAIKQASSETTT